MGRQVKRVALDFNWPLDQPWEGFVNPHYTAVRCAACDGSGSSPIAVQLNDLWYGKVPFNPEDRGSKPFLPDDEFIVKMIDHKIHWNEKDTSNRDYYYGVAMRDADPDTSRAIRHSKVDAIIRAAAIRIEAKRVCAFYNGSWSHHLNADDVAALVESGRLMDFTHTWTKGVGWKPKDPSYIPTPEEVNRWSLSGMGHDSINCWVCIKAECVRRGVPYMCDACKGDGRIWSSPEAEKAYESWEQTEPPAGEGYQVWETISEGSPISPVFATAEELAQHKTRWGADKGTPYETWLEFIRGPGWAPSMIMTAGGEIMNGVDGVVAAMEHEDG
jgi:hypothetical protein